VLHTGDLERDLIEMRGRRRRIRFGELPAGFARSLLHGFVADNDAAGGQQLLYHTQPEREPEIQLNRVLMISAGNRSPACGVTASG
jgi:hypothetical protein